MEKKEIKKTVIEEAQGVAGFLIPAEVLPSTLKDYFGLNSTFSMTVRGSMKVIDESLFFEVEQWKLR